MSRTLFLALFAICLTSMGARILVNAQELGARSAPTYTAAQAATGKTAYDQNCASCHGGNLDDGALAPALKGVAFMQKFGGKKVEDLLAKIVTMPPASPNSLGGTTSAAVAAYVVQANAILAGSSELPASGPALAAMTIPVGGFSVTSYSPYAPTLPAVTRPNPLDSFTPVSDAELVEPSAQDWLTWRRAYDAQGFS